MNDLPRRQAGVQRNLQLRMPLENPALRLNKNTLTTLWGKRRVPTYLLP